MLPRGPRGGFKDVKDWGALFANGSHGSEGCGGR